MFAPMVLIRFVAFVAAVVDVFSTQRVLFVTCFDVGYTFNRYLQRTAISIIAILPIWWFPKIGVPPNHRPFI